MAVTDCSCYTLRSYVLHSHRCATPSVPGSAFATPCSTTPYLGRAGPFRAPQCPRCAVSCFASARRCAAVPYLAFTLPCYSPRRHRRVALLCNAFAVPRRALLCRRLASPCLAFATTPCISFPLRYLVPLCSAFAAPNFSPLRLCSAALRLGCTSLRLRCASPLRCCALPRYHIADLLLCCAYAMSRVSLSRISSAPPDPAMPLRRLVLLCLRSTAFRGALLRLALPARRSAMPSLY